MDNDEHVEPTHRIDCYKNRVAQEATWSNPFCGLESCGCRFDLRAINASLIVMRCTELQMEFDVPGRDLSYGFSTTYMAKHHPRHGGGSGNGHWFVVLGIRRAGNGED